VDSYRRHLGVGGSVILSTLLAFWPGTLDLDAQTRTWTREEILARTAIPNPDHLYEPWPAHPVLSNVFYVGTRNLAAFLVTTSDGHILINSTFADTVPLVAGSIEQLGFEVTDIRIILGSHAHADHMEGNIRFRELSGAEVMVMAEDLPLLEQMDSGGAPQPVDRVLSDGDQVSLGGVTLTAHLTPGHTPGTTTWTFPVEDAGRTYQVVILGGGVTARSRLAGNPDLQEQFKRTFEVNRSLVCDVPLGPHTPMYRMEEKLARLGRGLNPFLDPEGCEEEMFLQEEAFRFRLEEQEARANEP